MALLPILDGPHEGNAFDVGKTDVRGHTLVRVVDKAGFHVDYYMHTVYHGRTHSIFIVLTLEPTFEWIDPERLSDKLNTFVDQGLKPYQQLAW